MAAVDESETQLLTEHFGYPPVSLLDDIINSVNNLAARVLDGLEQSLLATNPEKIGFAPKKSNKPAQDASATAPEKTPAQLLDAEVSNGTHQLETLLCTSIDRNFDKFELYVMRNILCVKPDEVKDYMRLGHYEGLIFDDDDDSQEGSSKPSAESVNMLRRKLQASQRLNLKLYEERARNEVLLKELRGLIGQETGHGVKTDPDAAIVTAQESSTAPLAFLLNKDHSGISGDADTPLTTTTAFSLSQLQSLRVLSTSLRKVLPDLRADTSRQEADTSMAETGDGEAQSDGKAASWRRARVGYVEKATRKHLETVRGLELGDHGEVRDGEWQAKGRKLNKGEVEELEKVVEVLEKAREDQRFGTGPEG